MSAIHGTCRCGVGSLTGCPSADCGGRGQIQVVDRSNSADGEIMPKSALMKVQVKAALLACAVAAFFPHSAQAGPPFLTDDPEPTEVGHWEIYAPFIEADGQGNNIQGSAGVELNYGAARDLQITVGVPVDFQHDEQRWLSGAGDLALSAKYRFYNNDTAGLQIAVFPGITLPTGSNGMGAGTVTGFLPVWIQKDQGPWSVFGGGGYAINPGQGNRDYWTGGLAVTRKFSERLVLGAEANRQGADTDDGHASTSLGFGGTYKLEAPLTLLGSGGPTFEDRGGATGYHGYLGLRLDF